MEPREHSRRVTIVRESQPNVRQLLGAGPYASHCILPVLLTTVYLISQYITYQS